MSNKISRRKFLGQAGCAALGTSTLLSSLMSMNALNALAAPSQKAGDEYKALVCILLSGGCDSFNLLVPRGDKYTDYATTRGILALPEASLLPLSVVNGDGRMFGLHPKLKSVQSLFNQGKATLVSSIGTLVHPIENVTDYKANGYKVPKGLYSHSDQAYQWQTSVPQSRLLSTGWGGRMADIVQTLNENRNISMNISLSGRNVFQSGKSVVEYTLKDSGVVGITKFEGGRSGLMNQIRGEAIDNILSQEYGSILESTYAGMNLNANSAFAEFSETMKQAQPFVTPFSTSSLSQKMKMIASVISTRNVMKMNRQTFFVDYGGWDHHSDLLTNQDRMFEVLDNAIGEFYSALAELGLQDKVTLFTISDFSRTMTSNETGTDHAWGGNSLVVGGSLNGNRIYGTYPDLYLKDNPLLTSGRGVVIPQVSTDQYFAEMALWFGLSPSYLVDVLPNIGNFYSHTPGSSPLGFMKNTI
jgi:uncharacterized protein (DUF1501 family)